MGVPGTHKRKKVTRIACDGWSAHSTRAFHRRMYGVDVDELPKRGYAVTLTVRQCPETGKEWHRIRRAWIKRLERMGLICLQWLTEWQKRCVPHLHCAFFMPGDTGPLRQLLVDHWLAVAGEYRPNWRSQTIKPLNDRLGWLKYLAKHASRGLKHYQRQARYIPPGWRRKTGRMWGFVGKWPMVDADRYSMDARSYQRLRRLVRSWRVSDARKAGNRALVRFERRLLRCTNPAISGQRGMCGWIPKAISGDLVRAVAYRGPSWSDKGLGGLITCGEEVLLRPEMPTPDIGRYQTGERPKLRKRASAVPLPG